MQNTKVKDLMACDPLFISPEDTLKKAAEQMKKIDCGILPVGDEDDVKGIITDRDIVIRAVAAGKDPAKEKVKTYMTKEVYSCKETDTLKHAAEQMRKHKVSRLVVKDGSGEVTGILSFGHILRNDANAGEISQIVECAVGRKAA